MGCGCSSRNYSNNTARSFAPIIPPAAGSCDLSLDILNTWNNILLCVKSNGLYSTIGTSEIVINQYLGLVQSAKNYPENYCYYSVELEKFKTILLQKIIQNATICIQ
jgi:hypothetical protein